MKIKPITQVKNLSGKKILLRADFNVPVKNGKVQDNFKIVKSLATIKFLLLKGARVILVSHLGRPKGYDKKLTLMPIKNELVKLLNIPVDFISVKKLSDLNKAVNNVNKLKHGEVVLVDNARFIEGEEVNNTEVAIAWASLADIFVFDGFAVAHRNEASITGVTKFLPSYAGLLLAKEVNILTKVMKSPKKPLVVILGGAKVETKIPIIKNLLSKANNILVGGGIVSTYLWAKGGKVGQSLIGKEYKKEVLKYVGNKKVILPVDLVVGELDGKNAQVVPVNSKFKIPNSKFGIYDIGPSTVRLYAKYIKNAQTLIMNGALGVFEVNEYKFGTNAISDLFAGRAKGRAFGVAGGGETVEVLRNRGIINWVDLVSTGGGAMLEFLSGKILPGVEAVSK